VRPVSRSTALRHRIAAGLTVGGLLLALGALPGTAAAAPAPPAQPVPAPGSSSTVTWNGTIRAGANPTANCQAQLSDVTDVTITVPAGSYADATTTAVFSITWNDPLEFNDEMLTVVPPTGGGATVTADEINDNQSAQREELTFANPVDGVWRVRACPFSSTSQPYTGRLTLTTTGSGGGTGSASPSASASVSASPSGDPGPQSDRTFSPPVVVDTDDLNSVAEPSIEIAPDGAIYVSGPQGLGGARVPALVPGTEPLPGVGGDLLWRSNDGGRTFTFLGSYDGAAGGGDSDIVATPDGDLYASGLTLACISLARSDDRGVTWANNPAACLDGAGVADRQWNDTYGNDALYTGYGTLTQGLVLHRALVDGPLPINGPATALDPSADYQWPGVVDVNQTNGNAVMAWNTPGTSNGTIDQIKINGVTDAGGLLFEEPQVVATTTGDTFDSFVSIDHGTDGTLYAAWSERRPAARETWTMLAASRDGGATWATPVHVDTKPTTTVFPWVTAGDAGRVAVSYYGTGSGGVSPENLDVKDAGWFVYSSFSTDYGATFAEHRTTPDPMHQGNICTSGTGCAAGTRDLADFFETDLDKRGCLVTTYTDNSRDTVSPTGTRSPDEATLVAVVSQNGGTGLLADQPCGLAAEPVVAETPLATLIPLLAAGLIGVAVLRRRHTPRHA